MYGTYLYPAIISNKQVLEVILPAQESKALICQ